MIPINRASTKSLIAAPPNSRSASNVSTTVRLVMIDRPKVCRIEWLTMSANGSPAWRALFSRIRSNTTIVSCTLKPMTVSIAVTNSASTSTPKSVPRIANVPTTTITSWSRATSAETPNFTSWKRNVIQIRIPNEPTRMRVNAWPMRSALTTGPTVVSWCWPSIGPNFACSATATSPSLPIVGMPGPEGLGDGVGTGDAEGDGDSDGEGEADADGDAEATTEPEGDADPA